ncbi:cytosolic thiouridylase subunit Ctu1 [Orobanche gracilis]
MMLYKERRTNRSGMASEVATATLVKSRVGKLCSVCNAKRAALKRPKTFEQRYARAKECFYVVFEDEIHRAIVNNNLFLEEKYGLPLKVVSYKELYGWTMDDIVKLIGLKNNCTFCGVFRRQILQYGLPLKVVSYKELYGWMMDDIVKLIGLKNNCTFCGVRLEE